MVFTRMTQQEFCAECSTCDAIVTRAGGGQPKRRTAKGEARTAMAASVPSLAPKALTLSHFPSPVWVVLSVPPAY